VGRADDSAGSKKWQWNMLSPSTHCMLGSKPLAEASVEPLVAPSPRPRRIALQGGRPLPPIPSTVNDSVGRQAHCRREWKAGIVVILGLKLIVTTPLKDGRARPVTALAKEDSCGQN